MAAPIPLLAPVTTAVLVVMTPILPEPEPAAGPGETAGHRSVPDSVHKSHVTRHTRSHERDACGGRRRGAGRPRVGRRGGRRTGAGTSNPSCTPSGRCGSCWRLGGRRLRAWSTSAPVWLRAVVCGGHARSSALRRLGHDRSTPSPPTTSPVLVGGSASLLGGRRGRCWSADAGRRSRPRRPCTARRGSALSRAARPEYVWRARGWGHGGMPVSPDPLRRDPAGARHGRVAMISVHTSPLDQPGTGDAGGMNVYVVELAKRLAARNLAVEIYTRATSSALPPTRRGLPGRHRAPRARRPVRGAHQGRAARPAVRVRPRGAARRGPPRPGLVRRRALALLALRPGRRPGPRPVERPAGALDAHDGQGQERLARRRGHPRAGGAGDRRGAGRRGRRHADRQHRHRGQAAARAVRRRPGRASRSCTPAWTSTCSGPRPSARGPARPRRRTRWC